MDDKVLPRPPQTANLWFVGYDAEPNSITGLSKKIYNFVRGHLFVSTFDILWIDDCDLVSMFILVFRKDYNE